MQVLLGRTLESTGKKSQGDCSPSSLRGSAPVKFSSTVQPVSSQPKFATVLRSEIFEFESAFPHSWVLCPLVCLRLPRATHVAEAQRIPLPEKPQLRSMDTGSTASGQATCCTQEGLGCSGAGANKIMPHGRAKSAEADRRSFLIGSICVNMLCYMGLQAHILAALWFLISFAGFASLNPFCTDLSSIELIGRKQLDGCSFLFDITNSVLRDKLRQSTRSI